MEINFQNFLLSELRNRKKMSSTDKMEVMKTSFLLFVVSGLYSKSQRISEPELWNFNEPRNQFQGVDSNESIPPGYAA